MANIQANNGGGVGPGVTSVNGMGGDVDVSAGTGVTSVDGATGAVDLTGTYLALTGGTLSGALVGTLSTMTTAIRAGAANWRRPARFAFHPAARSTPATRRTTPTSG